MSIRSCSLHWQPEKLLISSITITERPWHGGLKSWKSATWLKDVIEIIKEVKPGKNKQTSQTINNQPQLSCCLKRIEWSETHWMIRNAVSYKVCLNFQKRSHLWNPFIRRFPQPQNYITNHQTSLEQRKYLDNMALFHVVITFKEHKRFMKTLHRNN